MKWIIRPLLTLCCGTLGVVTAGATPLPVMPLQISVTGEPAVIWKWATDRCARADIADTPFRAFKRSDGLIVAFSTHFVARALVGPNLQQLARDCSVVFQSAEDPDPRDFNDKMWISSLWTANGVDVYALGHQEYQAHIHPGRCTFSEYTKCWYNTVNLLSSHDGGALFAAELPRIPIASPAITSEQGQGRPRGFFEPSNLVERDGFVYALINTTGWGEQKSGVCLFRASIAKLTDWEVRTSEGWVTSQHNPYQNEIGPICETLAGLFGPIHCLVYHRPTRQYIALMTIPGGAERDSFAFSLSHELLTWSKPEVFLKTTSWQPERSRVYRYPAFFDSQAETRSFEDVGTSAQLILVRENRGNFPRQGTIDRDLIAIPIKVAESE